MRAVAFNWRTQLQNQVSRDIISKEAFEKLAGDAGITNDTEVVIYGDNNNWFAAYGFWLFKLYGHDKVRLLNGGRVKWLNEQDAPLTRGRPESHADEVTRPKKACTGKYRALLPEVLEASSKKDKNLVDVRSPDEFSGKIIAPPNLPETAQRALATFPTPRASRGQPQLVPMALSSPPTTSARSTWTKRALIPRSLPLPIAESANASSHTWFVLKHFARHQ